MNTATSPISAHFKAFEQVIHHIIFGKINQPKVNDNGEYPIRNGLMDFVPKGLSLLEMKFIYDSYTPIFGSVIDAFLNDVTKPAGTTVGKSYDKHPSEGSFDLFTADALYYSDLIRFKKINEGKSLQIQYMNKAENCIDILSFHVVHFLDLVSFIPQNKKTLSDKEYELILNHYQELLQEQKVTFE